MTVERQGELPIHLFQIPIDAIQSVVFGMKTQDLIRIKSQIKVMEDTLIDRLAISAEPIKFYQAKMHPTLFRANIEELK